MVDDLAGEGATARNPPNRGCLQKVFGILVKFPMLCCAEDQRGLIVLCQFQGTGVVTGDSSTWRPMGEGWRDTWGRIPSGDVLEHQHTGWRNLVPGMRKAGSPDVCRYVSLANGYLAVRVCGAGI